MRFAKLHGLGNDFILLDLRQEGAGGAPSPARSALWCDRHRGIGADGVLTLLPAAGGGARLVIHNSDGSVPEMCGNGARVAALWMATDGCTRPSAEAAAARLDTEAGPRPCLVWARDPLRGEVEVGMGPAVFSPGRELQLEGRAAPAFSVSLGNPHRVLFLDVPREELRRLAEREGPGLCRAENANIELVAKVGPQRFATVVFERGAGLTQACGTGACAVAAAAIQSGAAQPGSPITIDLPGGPLTITVAEDFSEVRMRGPAELVFRGELAE